MEDLSVKITRLASGLPVGGDIEYADRMTIARSWQPGGLWMNDGWFLVGVGDNSGVPTPAIPAIAKNLIGPGSGAHPPPRPNQKFNLNY
jgi:hypothetical protein